MFTFCYIEWLCLSYSLFITTLAGSKGITKSCWRVLLQKYEGHCMALYSFIKNSVHALKDFDTPFMSMFLIYYLLKKIFLMLSNGGKN